MASTRWRKSANSSRWRASEFGRLRPRHCGSSNTQAGQGSSGASSIVDVPGRAACDMNAMIVGRVKRREATRLRVRDFSLSEFWPNARSVMPSCSVVCVRVFMTVPVRPRPKYVIGPDGSPLTITDLPAPGYQTLGHPTQGWSDCRVVWWSAVHWGSLQPLHVRCRWISFVAILTRPAWPCWVNARLVSSNIGCNGGLDRLRHRGEFSYVVSRSDDMDLK